MEKINYRSLWADFFFWLVIILTLLVVLKKVKKFKFSFKKTLLTVLVLVIFALDWVALHDILKGQPSPYGEYMIFGLSFVIFGGMIFFFFHKPGLRIFTPVKTNPLKDIIGLENSKTKNVGLNID